MTVYPASAPTKKKLPGWLWLLVGAAIVLAACLVGSIVAAGGGDKTNSANGWGSDAVSPSPATQSKAAAVAPASASPSPAAAVVAATFGEGTYVVGKELPAGRYTATMTDNQYCYWERLKSDDGELDSVIANAVYMDKGKRSLTVKAGDKFVQFKGDCVWSKS